VTGVGSASARDPLVETHTREASVYDIVLVSVRTGLLTAMLSTAY
jgi:hypothetical protein